MLVVIYMVCMCEGEGDWVLLFLNYVSFKGIHEFVNLLGRDLRFVRLLVVGEWMVPQIFTFMIMDGTRGVHSIVKLNTT